MPRHQMRSAIACILLAATAVTTIGAGAVLAQDDPRAVLDRANAEVDPTVPGTSNGFSAGWWNSGDARALIVAHEVTGPDADAYDIELSSVGRDWNPGTHGAGVRMDFRPADLGWKEATLTVTYDIDADDDETTTDTLEIPLRGLATRNPEGVVAVSGLDFGTTIQGEPVDGTIVLRNTAEIPLTIEEIGTSTGPVGRVILQPSCDTTGPLAPGETCEVRVRAATAKWGSHEAPIGIRPSDPFEQQTLWIHLQVRPNPAWPDEDAPRSLSVEPFRAVGVTFGSAPRIAVRFWYDAVDERAVAGYTVSVRSPASGDKRIILDQQSPFPDPLRPQRSVETRITPGAVIEMWLRARDAAGNQSKELYGGATRFRLIDISKSTADLSSGWRSSASKGTAYRDSVVTTSRVGAWVSDRISGREFSLVARKTPASGKVEIWVDGKRVRVVDLYASRATGPKVVATMHLATNTTHRVKVVTRSSNGRTAATLDSWVVGN